MASRKELRSVLCHLCYSIRLAIGWTEIGPVWTGVAQYWDRACPQLVLQQAATEMAAETANAVVNATQARSASVGCLPVADRVGP